jgi:hypothetical protein
MIVKVKKSIIWLSEGIQVKINCVFVKKINYYFTEIKCKLRLPVSLAPKIAIRKLTRGKLRQMKARLPRTKSFLSGLSGS